MLGSHVLGDRLEHRLVVEGVDGEVKSGNHAHHLRAEFWAMHVGDVDLAEEIFSTWCLLEQPVGIGTQLLIVVFTLISQQHTIWQRTRKPLAYRESTTCWPYISKFNRPLSTCLIILLNITNNLHTVS